MTQSEQLEWVILSLPSLCKMELPFELNSPQKHPQKRSQRQGGAAQTISLGNLPGLRHTRTQEQKSCSN